VIAYADDVAIIFTGKYPQTLCDLMTAKLKKLVTWAERSGLGINPDKTELVLFSRKYKIPQLKPPKLKETNLSFSESAKYLGLVLDKKLDWNLNIQERSRKAIVALYTCRKAIGLKWGMSPYIVHWLYTAVVRPILLYGILVWWPALLRQTTNNKINKIERMAELCITGALRSTPSDALDAILNIRTLKQESVEREIMTAIRLRDSGY